MPRQEKEISIFACNNSGFGVTIPAPIPMPGPLWRDRLLQGVAPPFLHIARVGFAGIYVGIHNATVSTPDSRKRLQELPLVELPTQDFSEENRSLIKFGRGVLSIAKAASILQKSTDPNTVYDTDFEQVTIYRHEFPKGKRVAAGGSFGFYDGSSLRTVSMRYAQQIRNGEILSPTRELQVTTQVDRPRESVTQALLGNLSTITTVFENNTASFSAYWETATLRDTMDDNGGFYTKNNPGVTKPDAFAKLIYLAVESGRS